MVCFGYVLCEGKAIPMTRGSGVACIDAAQNLRLWSTQFGPDSHIPDDAAIVFSIQRAAWLEACWLLMHVLKHQCP